MTRRNDDSKDDMSKPELETLYREAGDVEPGSGLDRIVRARAAEASREARAPRRLPWVGGLVTASVAIVAIAVVLQQSPPGRPAPETGAALERSAPDAFMAPSMGAQSGEKAAVEGGREASDAEQVQPHAPPPAPSVAAPAAMQDSAATGEAEIEVDEIRRSRREDGMAERPGLAAEPARDVPAEIIDGPDRMLERIGSLIERGEFQRASELLETFRREFPGHDIPEEIEKALGSTAPPD